MVKDIRPGKDGSAPRELARLTSKYLLFSADDGQKGRELWKTNRSTGATKLVKNINASAGSSPTDITRFRGSVFFSAIGNVTGAEPWKSDGTTAGTTPVKNIRPAYQSSAPHSFTPVGDKLFFVAEDGDNGNELWKTDGTGPGTKKLPIRTFDPDPEDLTAVGPTLFFSATNDGLDRELWKSDGTKAGTKLVKDIRPDEPGGTIGTSSRPGELTPFKLKVYFAANDGTSGRELWMSDGSP